jgi:hypothetical protein
VPRVRVTGPEDDERVGGARLQAEHITTPKAEVGYGINHTKDEAGRHRLPVYRAKGSRQGVMKATTFYVERARRDMARRDQPRINREGVTVQRLALLALLLVACGSDSSGAPADDPVESSDLVGTWTIHLARRGECAGFTANGDLTLWLPTSPGHGPTVINFVSDWGFDPDRFGSLTGHTDLPSGVTELRLWKGVLVQGALLSGTMTAASTFTGVLSDPIPGYGPIFAASSCVWDVTGERTGSAEAPPPE